MVKSFILWLHKWLGLTTGIVVVILGLTGCVYTFFDELKLVCYPDRYILDQHYYSSEALPLSKLKDIAGKQLNDGESISRVDLYPEKNRSWIFRVQEIDPDAFGYWNYFKTYKRIFLNPYTGDLLFVENSKTEFFQVILQMHMNLLLGKKYGTWVVGISTIIFVVILISGMVLWWPKRWKGKTLKRSLWIDWKSKWKRLNYDLHNVLGFYSLLISLVLAITGLVFTYPSFKKAYISFFNSFDGSEIKELKGEPFKIPNYYPEGEQLDNALHFLLEKYSKAGMMSIRSSKAEDETFDVQIRMTEMKTGNFRWYYFNKKQNSIEKVTSSDNLKAGDRIGTLNYDIHTGNISGLPTKILAFLISLICASLPITGFVVWRNKVKGQKRKAEKQIKKRDLLKSN